MKSYLESPHKVIIAMNKLLKLFSDESKWNKGSYRRDKNGQPVSYVCKGDATSYCLMGGLMEVVGGDSIAQEELASIIRDEIHLSRQYSAIIVFNDLEETKFKDIIDVIQRVKDRAIKMKLRDRRELK